MLIYDINVCSFTSIISGDVRDAPSEKTDATLRSKELSVQNSNLAAFPPEADMNQREWLVARLIVSLAYGLIILIPLPMLLSKGNALGWISVMMGLGPLLAGLWLFATIQPEANRGSAAQKELDQAILSACLKACLIVAAIVTIGAWLIITFADQGWSGYSLLKSGGLLTYVLFGLAPVIAYVVMLQRLLTMRTLGPTIVLSVVSLLAPWYWVGFMVYGQYHAL